MDIKDRITRLNANVIEFRNTQFLIKEDTFDKRTNEIYDYGLITYEQICLSMIQQLMYLKIQHTVVKIIGE